MTAPISIALIALALSLGLAYWLGRRQNDRAAFSALIAAPIVAGLAFVAVGALPKGAAATATASPEAATSVAPAPATAVAQTPASAAPTATNGLVEDLRKQGEELRRAKRYAEARDVYAKITQTAPLDADAWADLGDASAAAAGGDLKTGITAIDRALQIDANNPKALWLKASLELQEKRYASAVDLWQRLLNQLPKDSSDARIVSANLEETRSLAAKQGAAR